MLFWETYSEYLLVYLTNFFLRGDPSQQFLDILFHNALTHTSQLSSNMLIICSIEGSTKMFSFAMSLSYACSEALQYLSSFFFVNLSLDLYPVCGRIGSMPGPVIY